MKTLGKGENVGYQHFLLFSQCFERTFYSGLLKSGLCGIDLRLIYVPGNPLSAQTNYEKMTSQYASKTDIAM